MYYVFSFLGEFGYELLNWQGVIRKWCRLHKNHNDKIVICTRQGLESIYEFADYYIDISEIEMYKTSTADCYWSYVFVDGTGPHLPRKEWKIARSGEHIRIIKNEITEMVLDVISNEEAIQWIWSSDYTVMNGSKFGLERPGGQGGIYNIPTNQLDLNNNEYRKIQISNSVSKVQQKLDISLDEDFILCQTGYRKGYDHKSSAKINHNIIFDALNKKYPVVILDFDSGRFNDSYSKFDDKYIRYICNTFNEQSVLINKAKICVFTTEGDFRSHLYLPPMLGKHVDIIASQEVWNLPSAPWEFWNRNVFTFGGQMIPHTYENMGEILIR